jgi:hypothetical protein
MDYFLLFRYQLLEGADLLKRLDSLEVELLRLEDEQYSHSTKFHFTNLTFSHNFRQAVTTILKTMHDLSLSFTNIRLVCEDPHLFTHLLPSEFHSRSLSMPFLFTNFLDWRAVCRDKYGCACKSLPEAAK